MCNLGEVTFASRHLSDGGRPFHPSVSSFIHPSSSSRKKKMMEEEDNDEWRQQQFIIVKRKLKNKGQKIRNKTESKRKRKKTILEKK
jgi:hypothetical protein